MVPLQRNQIAPPKASRRPFIVPSPIFGYTGLSWRLPGAADRCFEPPADR